jgi:hypothetical protein
MNPPLLPKKLKILPFKRPRCAVARLTETPLPLADGAVKRKQRLGGKYVSLSVTVNVRAPELVTRVYEELGKDTRVKMKF